MVQNHDFALPLALRKIVYKPLAVKSIVPTLLRPTCDACLSVTWRCGCTGTSWEHDLPPTHCCSSLHSLLHNPILTLDKYSYYTYFMSVKHHQPLSFGH